MKLMKRATALLLCFLMLTNGPISAFATEGVSDNDVVVETTTTTEIVEVCEECGGSDAHTDTCSFNIAAPLTTETPDETTEPTTTPTEEPTTIPTVVTEPAVTTGPAINTDPVGCTECNQTEGHLESCSQYVAPTEETTEPTVSGNDVVGCTECNAMEGHTTECSQYEAPIPSIVEQLLTAESVEDMYIQILDLMQNNPETLMALSADEITVLRNRINELDPEGDDVDTQDLLDTLAILPNGGEELEGDPVMLPTEVISGNQTWVGNATLSEDTTWNFHNGAIVTLKAPITIPSGKTLTLTGWGGFARHADNKTEIFIVESGGKLVIEGTSKENQIIIDGKNVIANTPLITSSGELDFEYAVIQNGKNRATKSLGGGIRIYSGGSLLMDGCTVTKNTAKEFGGGIYCANGTMTINNSVISQNTAATDSDEATNLGRGGGFEVTGSNASCTLNNTIIEENQALYYGGGGQVDNHATITMNDGTIFRNNKAVLHGAGALHLTADATFIMNGGSMENNFAQYCGGAIHSSYSCILELNEGEIKNNVTNGRGGGIHINTGGAITLNELITISGNRANKQNVGTSADVDLTGDSITNIKYEGTSTDFGYGGGILIDSGTCTVAGATITNNYAEVGGGGIALTMLNMGAGGLDDLMVIKFTMTAGTVSNNTTAGDGAGVYIMTNKALENMTKTFLGEGALTLEEAKKQINDTNKHGFTADMIIDGIPEAIVSGGTISDNNATNNGGGLYLGERTKFVINGGSISSNKAVDGAGVYVASGTAEINGGNMKSNQASRYGGALYIEGNVTMTDGTIGGDAETAANVAVNGGAMYVTNGNVTIKHGAIIGNKAVGSGDLQDTSNNTGRGGAVYLAGDTDTLLTMESGTMNQNTATNDGGAIYATGGTILIGLADCSTEQAGAECTHHTNLGSGRHHPIIKANKAGDTGGGIALTDGVVRFYCGKAKENQALYKGVGKNVFMDGGKFHLYDGADVGVPRDPDLVIVGGELHNECVTKDYLNLYYYFQNTDTTTQMQGLAELNEVMNLPDGEYFWDAPVGHVFLGWTAQGAASGNQSNEYVRNKEQYVNSGDPVEILDAMSSETDQTAQNTNRLFDGKSDKTLHLYALWVPEKSNITYVNGLTGLTIPNTDTDPDNPATYDFNRESNIIQIQPVKHTGYDLVGWYIYQDADQNANWNDTQSDYENLKYEPNYKGTDYSTQKTYIELDSRNGVLSLETGNTNFGNITLIAKFEPAYTDLKITKTGWQTIDENQMFIFKITGKPNNEKLDDIEMTVTIQGNGFVLIKELPVGDYTVTEITDWSWRYTPDDATQEVQLVDSSKTEQVDFSNTRSNIYWLSGDSYCTNWWGGENGTVTKRKASN